MRRTPTPGADPAGRVGPPPRSKGGDAGSDWLRVLDDLYLGSWNSRILRFRSRFAYRGVPTASGGLETSLARLAGAHRSVERIEQGLLRSFRKYATPDLRQPDTVWHWLALAQHAGLPTRLLDWTYSPLVALHFVTSRLDLFGVDGEVWCVDFARVNQRLPRRLLRRLEVEQSDALTVEMLNGFSSLRAFDALGRSPFVVFVEPPVLHSRVETQHALFSLMPGPTAQLEPWLRRHPEVYRRVTVPAIAKPEIRDKLDQANITERVLEGGLDGLCRWLARYYAPA